MIALDVKQTGVLNGFFIGLICTVTSLAASAVLFPKEWAPRDDPTDRIAFALRADLFLGLWLAFSISRLGLYRFSSPDDIEGGVEHPATPGAADRQNTLLISLEQTVLAVVAHTSWSVVAPIHWVAGIGTAVVLFLIGNIIFTLSYANGAHARSLGFALTFQPSVIILIGGAICLIQ
mmetsp:Transcript_10221/g.21737  ORF Transcript_10221/g.21737 Transcript_10221/m.21737 type:complete len:177 (+) Transcript_10221:287-817(+)